MIDKRIKDYIIKNKIKVYKSKGKNNKVKYFALVKGKVLTFNTNPLTAATYIKSTNKIRKK